MNQEQRLKAAEAYAQKLDKFTNLDTHAFSNRDVNDIVSDTANKAFLAGAEAEAQSKWISVDERTPCATEIGDWDGLRSDLVLAINQDDEPIVARIYEGTMDGSKFCDWVDTKDNLIEDFGNSIVKWQYITP